MSVQTDGTKTIWVEMPKQHVTRVTASIKKKPAVRKFHVRDSIERRMTPPKPGTPKYQRYLNGKYFRDLQRQLQLDDEDFDPFEDDEWVEDQPSFFRALFEDDAKMEVWLALVKSAEGKDGGVVRASSAPVPSAIPAHRGSKHRLPRRFYKPVLQAMRSCGYMEYLCESEMRIIEFTGTDEAMLALELESSFHRLLFHAIASYYNLSSWSEWRANVRTTIVQKDPEWEASLPRLSLINYVLEQ